MRQHIETRSDGGSRSPSPTASESESESGKYGGRHARALVLVLALVMIVAAVLVITLMRERRPDTPSGSDPSGARNDAQNVDREAAASPEIERSPANSKNAANYLSSDAEMAFVDESSTRGIAVARDADRFSNLPPWERDLFNGTLTAGEFLLKGRAIQPDRVGDMFKSDRFEQLMDTLRAYPGDAEMARDYSTLVRASLKQTLGRGNRVRYACSDRICMVTIYSNQSPPLDLNAWFGEFQRVNGSLATTYVHDGRTPRPGGYRIRMLIAVDPRAVNPLPPTPPTGPGG